MDEKLTMRTKDLRDDNVEAIAQLFPSCVTESIAEDGSIRRLVDFEALKRQLSGDIIPDGKERYVFTWPGKSKSRSIANASACVYVDGKEVPVTLRPSISESVNFESTNNIYIKGDNLNSLKLLRETYLGRIKMIYIDPPYNTGNDFIYKDDYSISSDEFSIINGDIDSDGNKLLSNADSSGRFHTNWLNMIYPRLLLSRDLLKEDGVIFISIDDVEVANLIKVCDEIFGGSNFVADLIWQSRTSISNDYEISNNHNHTLIYSKNRQLLKFGGDDIDSSDYENPDNDTRGPYILVPIDANHPGGDTQYPIRNPKTGVDYYPPNGRSWCYNHSTLESLMADGRIKFGKTDLSAPKRKLFLSERLDKGDVKTPSSIMLDAGTTKDGTEEIMSLFNGKKVFDYPKPTSFIRRLIKYGITEPNEIVLDFFAGSSTTAQAVLMDNEERKLNTTWILIQLPVDLDWSYLISDNTSKPSIKRAIEYLDSCHLGHYLTDLGLARIRNYIQSVKNNDLDLGYRVFKIDTSNMNDVFYNPKSIKKNILDYIADNIKSDRTSEDLLFQVMLELGIELSASISIEYIDGKEVLSVDNNYLIACFDQNIDEKIVTSIAKREPYHAVFRDSSLSSDATAVNFNEIFKMHSPNTKTRVL